ncbi:MAG: LytTR family DNA-binding domain-containing protein [Bacteroidota bacterium]
MIRTLIVDDERHFINNLKSVCAMVDDIEIVSEARSVMEGIEKITEYQPDLVFLDIEMDDGTGFDLLNQFSEIDFSVIFITAHDHYAIEAFKFSAQDYLLKPLISSDLFDAIERMKSKMDKNLSQEQLNALIQNLNDKTETPKKIVLRDAESIHIISPDEILWCEADGSYCKFVLSDNREITISHNLQEYETMLSMHGFFRVHRSFLVNLHKVKRFQKSEGGLLVLEEDRTVPVATRRREQVIDLLAKL